MTRLFVALSLFCAVPSMAESALAGHRAIERQQHDHTIYVLSGDPSALATFQEEIGANWDGGILLDVDNKGGRYRYWAYDWRTAPQSRAFIASAVRSGLELKFENYDDFEAFPETRDKLDRAALGCGFKNDPFLIFPSSEIALRISPDEPIGHSECLFRWIRETDALDGMAIGFIGNEITKD